MPRRMRSERSFKATPILMGTALLYTPMSFGALGQCHWDEEAKEHVNLVANSGGSEGVFTPAEIFNGMIDSISVAIARGVGDIVLQGQQISIAELSGIRIGPP